MLLLLAAALAAPLPLPAHAPSARLEGFVRLHVEPDAFADGLVPSEPGSPPAGASAHEHATRPGRLVVLRPTLAGGADLDGIIAALAADPAAVVHQRDDAHGALVIDHPDALAVLGLPFGGQTLGDVVDFQALPTGLLVGLAKPPARADLPVQNVASARAVLRIGGVQVGEVGPRATAVIHDVPAGTYDLEFVMPNGYVRRSRATTAEGLRYEAKLRMR
jgi:hypothetical protein